ncbi:sulfide:quinone oxidoreductase [Rhodococcus sp. LBL1]|nr:sulfide:quinone oxidoreductase [Rhodococcus sp. LBL1]MDH6681201.1 sulfide:quinone oxidoreductase [Rhodococcus sp. LBL2]
MSRTVVVLGAGVGGLTAAAELRASLPDADRVVLVDRSFSGALGLSSLWVLRGWRTLDQIRFRPTEAALPGVSLVTSEVERIDIDTRTVHCDPAGPIGYDALVVALGADLNPASVPGLDETLTSEQAGHFYTPEAAEALHRRLASFESGRVGVLVTAVPFKCPAAPYEGAFLIADLLGERFTGGAVSIDVFTPEPLPMPVAGPDVGKALVGMLDAQGIGFHSGMETTALDSRAHTVSFADGTTESFDMLAVVPPHSVPAAVRESALSGPAGWIPVDSSTLKTGAPDVWAIGDNTALILPVGKPLPKAAIFAEAEGTVVAHQVARVLGYDAPDTRFDGVGECYVEAGSGMAAKGAGEFLATPAPRVTLHDPSTAFHDEKVQQERDWLSRWNVGEEPHGSPPT